MVDKLNLKAAEKRFSTHGPDRVMIDAYEATSSKRAREAHGINPDIVFVRNDGWMLGAPAHLEFAAYRIWADDWVGFVRRPNKKFKPMSEYKYRSKEEKDA